jgi:hypothetical protein
LELWQGAKLNGCLPDQLVITKVENLEVRALWYIGRNSATQWIVGQIYIYIYIYIYIVSPIYANSLFLVGFHDWSYCFGDMNTLEIKAQISNDRRYSSRKFLRWQAQLSDPLVPVTTCNTVPLAEVGGVINIPRSSSKTWKGLEINYFGLELAQARLVGLSHSHQLMA